MTTPIGTSRDFSVSQHLRKTKKILQNAIFGTDILTIPDKATFDVLEQDAFQILHLVRFWRNRATPISRIPSEILTLLPDFWDRCDRYQGVIALTHVCRAWREVFLSRPSLWTDLDCVYTKKTLIYLERSKSSPINLSLYRDYPLPRDDPFFRIDSNAIRRLKSLFLQGTPWNLEGITARLCHPAPLLEIMWIDGSCESEGEDHPALASVMFREDLSSLRELHLDHVDTELPWRNMVNLTTFELFDTPISVRDLLDFFESAPRLREVELQDTLLVPGAQNGRLVSLACLKIMDIYSGPISDLLDHLLIPAGARLTIRVDLPGTPIDGHPPKFLDNLGNLSDFTTARLHGTLMYFTGPNGEVSIAPVTFKVDETHFSLQHLTQFNTWNTKRLEINCSDFQSIGITQQAFHPMRNLCTLTLYLCKSLDIFVHALDPRISPSGDVVCPKLGKLVIEHREALYIKDVIGMAAARASIGAKLKSVKIVSWGRTVHSQLDVLELEKHVLHVECGGKVDAAGGDSDKEE